MLEKCMKVVVLKPEEVVPRPDLVGTWLDESHYKFLVEEDMDLYLPPECSTGLESGIEDCGKKCNSCESGLSEKNIVFKFRKNYFSPEMVQSAYDGLRDAAQPTQNRGTAAGERSGKLGGREWVTQYHWDIINAFKANAGSLFEDEDPIQEILNKYETEDKSFVGAKAVVWLTGPTQEENFVFDEWVEKTRKLSKEEAAAEAKRVEEKLICKTRYANEVFSGIAGWYDRYPRIPWGRATSYTDHRADKFAKSYPYLQKLSEAFKEMLPWRYSNQSEAASKVDPKFLVPGTPFSTITVNKSFRTAAHYDPANMENGFANICNISVNGNYTGGYLVFPEIGYAVNIRPGDLLFVNNMAGLHGNTELIMNDEEAERITMIAFFHEGMLTLGSWDYEQYRKSYVDACRTDQSHPFWKQGFNGVFPGMWADASEPTPNYANAEGWYKYLKQHPQGDDWLVKHHSRLKEHFERESLEDFFA